jgi:beta-xylosidase
MENDGGRGARIGADSVNDQHARPTLALIAAEAGVSQATVSKVLNGRTDVAPRTRERVEELLKTHNYLGPGGRRSRRSGLIDLVIGGLDSPWAVEIMRGVEAECAERGMGAVVSLLREDDATPPSWTSLPALHHSDGVILVISRMTHRQREQLEKAGVALVVIDPVNLPDSDIASVGATNWAGGLAATEHLLSLGHQRIAVISGTREMLCSQARVDGYRAALERADVELDRALIRYGDFRFEGAFLQSQALLELADPPTAIFAGSDQQAMGTYEAARLAGLRVPQDLSVVGFDDLPLCRWLSPPLTTVRQPLEEMGRTAARTLFQLLDGEDLVSTRVELATELRVRHSTAPPRVAPRPRAAVPKKPVVPGEERWRDAGLPVADRVADLVSRMTLEEKVGQLGGFWAMPSEPGEPVAPMEDDDTGAPGATLEQVAKAGLGQLTRVFGTSPVTPADGARRLLDLQTRVARANRFGIPAIAHEECLTGFMTWTATIFPCPLAWGASFDPDLVQEMATAIGTSMRDAGVHQGLAPVLDVVRDYRWGRTEECVGEDPYLVAAVGTAYVRGLERAGVIATLKHFAGYASSRAGRNMAPTAMGPRELADVVLEPFVTALREGGARSVMHAYTDVDGVPAAADERLLTDLLRGELGFTGMVVADYFGISFLESRHGVAGAPGEAAALALRAGVDVELPTARCYAEPLLDLVRDGEVDEEFLDRSVARVLTLKAGLGLLEETWEGELAAAAESMAARADLDPPEHRQLARRLAEESVVLLANDGILPLDASRVALVGPLADDPLAMMGCYSFPNHIGVQHPDLPLGVAVPTLADALRGELPDAAITVVPGCDVRDPDGADIAAAAEAARDAQVCVLALGDRAGMFGRGTSGEGCDADTLALPGRQRELAEAVLATGTPTVLVMLSGRPYALGGLVERAAAVVQAFFPGEDGGAAIAGVLSGRVEPSGRLPVSVPGNESGQPGTYLRPRLGGATSWSSVDPTPLFPFGHGLTWTEFGYSDLRVDSVAATDGSVSVSAVVRNAGDRPGTEVVQLYLSDPVASVVRPVRWLAGWARVRLEPGRSARVEFTVHADRTSFTGRDLRRIVEPGRIDVAVGSSSADTPLQGSFTLEGPARVLGADRVLTVPVEVTPC